MARIGILRASSFVLVQHLASVLRQNFQCVFPIDASKLLRCEAAVLEPFDGGDNAAAKRIIRAEHDLFDSYKLFQGLQRDRIRRQRDVVVKTSEMIEARVRLRRLRKRLPTVDRTEKASNQSDDGSACMRPTEAHVGKSRRGRRSVLTTLDHAKNSPSRVGLPLDGAAADTRLNVPATG